MILPGLWRDLAQRAERVRNLAMRTVFRRFASINEFEAKISSQNGEDGIIAELFRRIGTTNRFFVEFGASDGRECNTAALARAGWSGVMLEGDDDRYARLVRSYAPLPSVKTVHTYVTVENIVSLFETLGIPQRFDLLSIDVDGNDYWLWKALHAYHPRVVVIEYNAEFPPPQRWVMRYNPDHRWDKTTYYGASLASLAALGETQGYMLLGTDSMGVNAFFVAADQSAKARFPNRPPLSLYHAARYRGANGEIGHARGSGPFVEI